MRAIYSKSRAKASARFTPAMTTSGGRLSLRSRYVVGIEQHRQMCYYFACSRYAIPGKPGKAVAPDPGRAVATGSLLVIFV